MFQIGSSLREARLRQGLDLVQAEQGTRIRTKYLAALEDDRFDALPGDAYAKGFLRTYAEFLGLDGELYVEEFKTRYGAAEQLPPPPPVRVRTASRQPAVLVAAAAAVVGVLALAGILAGRAGGPEHERSVAPPATSSARVASTTVRKPTPRPPRKARLRLVAARGDCWLSVRLGSAAGRVVFEGTLAAGESRAFTAKRLWIRIGAPWNLDVRLNGETVRTLPIHTGNLLVTRTGTRPA